MEYDLQKLIASMWEHRKNNDFEQSSLKSFYRGLSVKASIGMSGNISKIPWISFCAKGQKTHKGIYPVLLFYGTPEFLQKNVNHTIVKKIVLAYGVSATEDPDVLWGSAVDNKKTIADAFVQWNYSTSDNGIKKYNSSFVFEEYDWDDNIDYEKIQADIDRIIDIYLGVLGSPVKIISTTTPIKTPLMKSTKTINCTELTNSILSTGLIYSPTLIKRLAYSLMAKPFVILSGLAGSGKTQLALAFAKCLSENIKEQVCTVSIGADWTNREPLLGYPNALKSGEYVLPESGVLQLLMRANEDPSKPYFLILDEMNLSVVERYFADFLSAMESGESIKLWDNEAGIVPKEIELPKNVFIIGTINVDETTYMFSPKVLDRANVIEFKIAPDEMEDYLGKKININLESAYSTCADMAVDFVNKANSLVEKDEKNKDVLLSFFKELKKVNAEFGYRTVNEISRYLHFAEGNLEDDSAIDTAILQKLLPKLHGSHKKLVPALTSMWQLCLKDGIAKEIDAEFNKDDFKYPESAEKIQRMYNAVVDNGFTSFAEA